MARPVASAEAASRPAPGARRRRRSRPAWPGPARPTELPKEQPQGAGRGGGRGGWPDPAPVGERLRSQLPGSYRLAKDASPLPSRLELGTGGTALAPAVRGAGCELAGAGGHFLSLQCPQHLLPSLSLGAPPPAFSLRMAPSGGAARSGPSPAPPALGQHPRTEGPPFLPSSEQLESPRREGRIRGGGGNGEGGTEPQV
ncbi:uncharacterized protein LOC143824825 [Paroedura picta]|uniref:uncharacterized protein LOC143824825 n=1 Tax=Paroedura picta TaxID=143630 RepID=UPI0040564F2F